MTEFANRFTDLEYPRATNARRHSRHDIPVIAFGAMLCGGQTGTDMELFGQDKRELLQSSCHLENGISGHDAFSRLLGRLDPQAFRQWFVGLMPQFPEGCEGALAVDGKT